MLVAAVGLSACDETSDPTGGPTEDAVAEHHRPDHRRGGPNNQDPDEVLIEITGGDGQEGAPGEVLPAPLSVAVTDGSGAPMRQMAVRWTVEDGGGSLSETTMRTDGQGRAEVQWTLGSEPGEYGVEAAADEATAGFTATVLDPSSDDDGDSDEGNDDSGDGDSGDDDSDDDNSDDDNSDDDDSGDDDSGDDDSNDDDSDDDDSDDAPEPGSLVVSPGSVTLDAIGAEAELEVEARDFEGSTIEAEIEWSSSDPSVVDVDEEGTVIAKAVGIASIVAAASCCDSDTVEVVVEQIAETIEVSPATATVSVGETLQLEAEARDAGGTAIADVSFEWTSGDARVAEVDGDGTVTAVADGSTQITASTDGAEGSSAVQVEASDDGDIGRGAPSEGIWLGADEIADLPTSGSAWDAVASHAGGSWGGADISDQNSNHDVYTLAGALVCARTGEYCDKAVDGVLDAIGTEEGARWLAVGRNLMAYVIAADLLGLRADGNSSSAGSRTEAWIESFLMMELAHNNTGEPQRFIPFMSGSNAAAQEGAAYASVAAYLDDSDALQRVWDAYRTYACDPTAPDHEDIDVAKGVEYGWAHDDANPCAVNPQGTSKVVPSGLPGAGNEYRIDGAIINDMRRGGEYQWEPGYTSYAWVGLEGFVPAALLLHRAGYPAFEVADRAVLRTHEYLWYLRSETGETSWFDGVRSREAVQLVNFMYGASYPVNRVVGLGRTFGYTDWTHPTR